MWRKQYRACNLSTYVKRKKNVYYISHARVKTLRLRIGRISRVALASGSGSKTVSRIDAAHFICSNKNNGRKQEGFGRNTTIIIIIVTQLLVRFVTDTRANPDRRGPINGPGNSFRLILTSPAAEISPSVCKSESGRGGDKDQKYNDKIIVIFIIRVGVRRCTPVIYIYIYIFFSPNLCRP